MSDGRVVFNVLQGSSREPWMKNLQDPSLHGRLERFFSVFFIVQGAYNTNTTLCVGHKLSKDFLDAFDLALL